MASLELASREGALEFSWKEASVVGDDVVLALARPVPEVEVLLSSAYLVPAEVARDGCVAPTPQAVGTGPWRHQPTQGAGFRLEANLEHPRAPRADVLEVVGIRDPAEAQRAILAGTLDIARLSSDEVLTSGSDGVTLAAGTPLAPGIVAAVGAVEPRDCARGLLLFRDGPNALHRIEERRALAMALRRDELDDLPVNARFNAGRRLLGGSQLGYDPGLEPLAEDADAARMAWAGRTAPIRVGAYPSDGPLIASIAAQAGDAGIEVVEVESLNQTLERPAVDAFLGVLCAPAWGDEALFLFMGFGADLRRLSFGSERTQAALEALMSAPDRSARAVAYAELEASMMSDLGFIPIGNMGPEHLTPAWLVREDLDGFVVPGSQTVSDGAQLLSTRGR